jgi:seryl-tRNA synthetase
MLTKVDVGSFNLQMSKKLDKDEYIRFMSKMSLDEDKFKRAIELGDEIQVKLDKMTEAFDKKILKLKKEVDPAPLAKQLKTKAEDDNVIKGFTNVDIKIQAVTEAIGILKKDIETAMLSIRTVGTQMTKFSDTGLLTTKPIGPQNCLSCGGSTTNNLPPGTVKS